MFFESTRLNYCFQPPEVPFNSVTHPTNPVIWLTMTVEAFLLLNPAKVCPEPTRA